MIENYLQILEESLHKKIAVLDEIVTYNNEQAQLIKKENASMEELDENMERKDALIEQLENLDQGFESLYEKIREQLIDNKESYKEQINRLQDLISSITEKSTSIQAQEERNKKLIEDYLVRERQQIGQGRQTSKAAYEYYKSMSNSNVVPPQFMNHKK